MRFLYSSVGISIAISTLLTCVAKVETPSSPEPGVLAIRSIPGGNCEDCELMFIGMPLQPAAIDTSPGWASGKQQLKISGTIYHLDGKTPADKVLVYYYHTDDNGYYPEAKAPFPSAKKHGHLRGWVKTGPDGRYAIYTSRPAPYPGGTDPAHIHLIIKESDVDYPYWIDAWVFDQDPLLTVSERNKMENRGGNGILKTQLIHNIEQAKQDIILGLNVPGYPAR